MFLEGYKRNWIQTEGYSFEDRMIDDLSVRHIRNLLHLELLVFFKVTSHFCFRFFCIPESNGAGGSRRRGGKGNKTRSPSPAHSSFQSHCSDRKEVRPVHRHPVR